MHTRTLRSKLGSTALLAAALVAAAARANGVFPSAGQLVVDPSDPSHIVVVATYGILSTRGAGPWGWTCEPAAGYKTGSHPSLAVTADGSVLAGVLGLRIARGD